MTNQIKFLIALNAHENWILNKAKVEPKNNPLFLPENEHLWNETGNVGTFIEALSSALNELENEVVNLTMEGIILPKNEDTFNRKFSEIIYNTCEEVELDISFDGYSYEEAREIAKDKEKFIDMLKNNAIEFSHLAYEEDKRVCILTIAQLEKLAILSIELEIYEYFGDFNI